MKLPFRRGGARPSRGPDSLAGQAGCLVVSEDGDPAPCLAHLPAHVNFTSSLEARAASLERKERTMVYRTCLLVFVATLGFAGCGGDDEKSGSEPAAVAMAVTPSGQGRFQLQVPESVEAGLVRLEFRNGTKDTGEACSFAATTSTRFRTRLRSSAPTTPRFRAGSMPSAASARRSPASPAPSSSCSRRARTTCSTSASLTATM